MPNEPYAKPYIEERFPDTNVLMEDPEYIFSTYDKVYICGYVLQELDRHKTSDSEDKKYKARRAGRAIEANRDKIVYLINECKFNLPSYFDIGSMDNKIVSVLNELYESNNNVRGLSNDLLFREKCHLLMIPCDKLELKDEEEKYNGIREVWLTDKEYKNLIESEDNPLNLCVNEYLIINNTTKDEQYLYIWNDIYFEEIKKVKPITNKYLSNKDAVIPLDIYQRAFIHMLQNDNVKVMITDSNAGMGKSYIMLHWALQQLDSGYKYNKLYFVKSDSPPSGRRDYPALPGDINSKSEPLLGVICDTTSEESMGDFSSRNNKVEILPIQFVRGRSLRKAILYINECQNFTPSEMKLLLSRIGEDTVVLIDGSTEQIDNKNCKHRNGLTITINNFKNKTIAAQVNMITDFRSEISKMVSEMDWHD